MVGLSEGTGPCDSATGCDARTYGVGLRWDSARRCCPIPENLGLLTGVLIGLTERRVILISTLSQLLDDFLFDVQ